MRTQEKRRSVFQGRRKRKDGDTLHTSPKEQKKNRDGLGKEKITKRKRKINAIKACESEQKTIKKHQRQGKGKEDGEEGRTGVQ